MPLVVLSISLAVTIFWPQIVEQLPDLTNRAEYRLTWGDVEISPCGRWVPQDLTDRVRQKSRLPESLSLLDDELVSQLSTAFARQPWVDSIESIRKQPGGIRVSLNYRQPVLMVQTKRGMYPVDINGVLLPPSDFSAADAKLFPRVDKVRSTPQGPAGMEWGDTAVTGAARLAAKLTEMDDHGTPWESYGLQSIVVLVQPGPVAEVEDVIFGLRTRTGSQIVWGHAPGADALEPTVEQKLMRLDKFLADNGGFEYLNQPVHIDIRDWELIRWEVLSRIPADASIR